ncbi:MAG: radical SAM family heme chaperone HemW [Bdellovibrionales bacterium]|nr:radical SAM family heme chaperone HemW [Bdellovibrionales bacterium]
MDTAFSLYVHVPFCGIKCPYCDFNTYAAKSIPEERYVEALLAELAFYLEQERWQGKRLESIYFGGGTPSLFSAHSFEKIIKLITNQCSLAPSLEVTAEINPGEISESRLADYQAVGINRLSFGAQSLIRDQLSLLGRKHTPADVSESLERARKLGFENCSLDLMYGLPGQTLEDLQRDLERFMALSPEHISAYTLTIEEGTPFYQRYKKGMLTMPPDELVADMMELVSELLSRNGLRWYEVSNFALPDFESRHNLGYWNYQSYLGLGAGAHSYLRTGKRGYRWANIAKPEAFMELVSKERSAQAWLEKLTDQEAMFEFFFLGLRKLDGVRLDEFRDLFGKEATEVYPVLLSVLEQEGFIEQQGSNLKLSKRGLLVADSVIANFSEPEGLPARQRDSSERMPLLPHAPNGF